MNRDVRILVVEDERKLAGAIQQGLEADEYSVQVAHTGEDGFFLAQTETFDLLILDVMLPGRDGFEILSALRQRKVTTPVLMLTARDTVADRVRGLDAGADDSVVKPFAFAELIARIRALVRRGRAAESPRLSAGDIEVDLITRQVTRGGKPVELTVREFELLVYLIRHQGQVVPRETLARDVWKEPSRTTPLDNVIDVHVARLRRKVDADYPLKMIHTVRGVGFMLREGEP